MRCVASPTGLLLLCERVLCYYRGKEIAMDRNMAGSLGIVAFGVVVIVLSLLLPAGEAAKDVLYLGNGVGGLGVFFLFFAWLNSK